MSDGKITVESPIQNVDHETLVRGLLPPNVEYQANQFVACDIDRGCQPVLKLDKLTGYGFSDISFEVYPGEILGIAGIVGAGRTELATTIFGKDTIISGNVYLEGKNVTGLGTHEMMCLGLNYVPEDRFLNGLFRISTVAENTTASCLDTFCKSVLDKKKEKEITDYFVESFRTKITGSNQIMSSLSGGNQQKVIIGRSIATKPKLLILDEPTRGIDAAARADVYSIINQLRSQGLAIVIISSDMEEVVELSDRIITMYSGRLVAEFDRSEVTHDALMAAAFGMTEGSK